MTVHPLRHPRAVLKQHWAERVEEHEDGTREFVRLDPRRVYPVSASATLAVAHTTCVKEEPVALPLEALEARAWGLFALESREDVDEMIRRIQRRPTPLAPRDQRRLVRLKRLAAKLDAQRRHESRWRSELEALKRTEATVREAIVTFEAPRREGVRELIAELCELHRDISWMRALCRPDFFLSEDVRRPNPRQLDETIPHTVAKLRDVYGIGDGRFLDVPGETLAVRCGDNPLRGAWHDKEVPEGQERTPRAQWLHWLEEKWMPRVKALAARFATVVEGRDEQEVSRRYVVALWPSTTQKLPRALDSLEPLGKASANLLARLHSEGNDVDYPYPDERAEESRRQNIRVMRLSARVARAVRHAAHAFEVDEVIRYRTRRQTERQQPSRTGSTTACLCRPAELELFVHRDTGRVITRQSYEQLSQEEQGQFEPFDPRE